jgi:hypothetical protein
MILCNKHDVSFDPLTASRVGTDRHFGLCDGGNLEGFWHHRAIATCTTVGDFLAELLTLVVVQREKKSLSICDFEILNSLCSGATLSVMLSIGNWSSH